MNLAYGIAKPLYAKQAHPRVLLGPADVAALRACTRIGDGRKIRLAVRGKAARLFAELAAAPEPSTWLGGNGTWSSLSARLMFAVDDMAITALLDNRADYVEQLRTILRALCVADPIKSRAGIRLANMALAFDLLHEHWTPEDRAEVVRAGVIDIRTRLEAARVNYFKSAGGNITLMSLLVALPEALALRGEPGVPDDFEGLLADLILRYEASVNVTANANGYPEEDGGYGNLIMARLVEYGEMLHRAGLFDVYTACPVFARSGRALLHFVQPWGGHLSNTGDHGDDFGQRELTLARLAARTKDPSLVWLLRTLSYTHAIIKPENANGRFYSEVPLAPGEQVPTTLRSLLALDQLDKGRPPALPRVPTAFCDRRRGIVSFRSGWDKDALFVVFDGSQRSTSAQGHAHASGGHFSLSAQGEYFSIDTGRYNIDQAQHSVVLVNGKPGRPQQDWTATKYPARLIACEPGALADYAAVDTSHQYNIYWARRHLLVVKGAHPYALVVDDLNACDDWAEYVWQMQVCPENTIETRPGGATVTGWRHGNKLDVHMMLPAPEEYPRPHTVEMGADEVGTGSWAYNGVPEEMTARVAALKAGMCRQFARPSDMVHGPVHARPRLFARVSGYNGRFMSLMIPRKKGDAPAVVERLKSLPNVLAARIRFADGTEDRVAFAFEHRLLKAEGMDRRGEWAVLRRTAGGRKQEQVFG
jgi:hypothetical protein